MMVVLIHCAVIITLSTVAHQDLLAQRCSRTSVGLTPINDLAAGLYRGEQGGLYPGGLNTPPDEHRLAGISLANQIQPLNGAGEPDPVSGKVVLLSVGMSNSWQEFGVFREMVETFGDRNRFLVVVNGAQPGNDIDTILDPESGYWLNVRDSLAVAGVTPAQVQVVWFKQAEAYSSINGSDTSFAGYVEALKLKFQEAMNMIRSEFPHAQSCYLASRSYGGYASILLNPEPFAYYTGWAVKFLIEDQINGVAALRYQGTDPQSPWLDWGTYLWADGMQPRSDGLIWECDDFQRDGTHPSEAGEIKVATQLLEFFSTDETSTIWFLDNPSTSVDPDPAIPRTIGVVNYPNPFNPETRLRFEIRNAGHVRLSVMDLTGRVVREVVNGYLPEGVHETLFRAGDLGSGVYLYQLTTEAGVIGGKMMLIR